MDDKTKDKLAKVYELVRRGVDGEKEAAKAALDRLMAKYDLSDEALEDINLREYRFKYSTNLELWLVQRLHTYFFEGKELEAYRDLRGKREMVLKMEHLDFVVLESSYEYFKRHMKGEYNRIVLPALQRCRKAKTRNKRRAQLQNIFFSKYVIASKLYKEGELKKTPTDGMSLKQLEDIMKMQGIKGGEYSTQVTTGLYLN